MTPANSLLMKTTSKPYPYYPLPPPSFIRDIILKQNFFESFKTFILYYSKPKKYQNNLSFKTFYTGPRHLTRV